ncbi:biotin-dependent carboxyltransferase [bacterium SCSIO 12696]|nr:biotin-dependent carboxyltransferase [bacterium SCSIO 12696]
MLANLQDAGRSGVQKLGITTGGPLDSHAFAWGNRLLANPAGAAQIEIAIGGFCARFEKATWIAVTGADMDWHLDGKKIAPWCNYRVATGSELSSGFCREGMRSYLAVVGGFVAEPIFGSCATVLGDGLGGLDNGEPLSAGDQVGYGDSGNSQLLKQQVPSSFIPRYGDQVELRIVPSNQFYQFPENSRQQFFNQAYCLGNQSDRMGCRFEGQPIDNVPANMVSEAVPLGAVQIPSDGLPIVLLNDRQTIGGYPKLGSVYQVDLPKLAQCRPGDQVRFCEGSLQQAQQELREFRCFF